MPTHAPLWSRSDWTRPATLVTVVLALVLTAGAAAIASCNIHEVGHAMTASMLGWDVERIDLCLPSEGSVVYASVGTWAGNLQGYAGGLLAATFLVGVYLVVFARPVRPLLSPAWWAAGLGLILPVGPQVAVGILEGLVLPGEDYTVRHASLLPWLVTLSLVASATLYVWRWREVWRTA